MRKKAFTLIELLVVISVIALLLAIFLPVLGRVRTSAKSLTCQSKLRQWGLIFSTYAAEHNCGPLGFGSNTSWHTDPAYDGDGVEDLLLCPEAARPGPPAFAQRTARDAWNLGYYTADGTFDTYRIGSYGVNHWLTDGPGLRRHGQEFGYAGKPSWDTWAAKHWYWIPRALPSSRVPLVFDCVASGCAPDDFDEPPQFEDDFAVGSWGEGLLAVQTNHMRWECLNRHSPGKVNVTFLDGSTRPVGFKELWTFKWHSKFNTTGPWTRAGGAIPTDWPEWMQRFKDY